LASKKTRLRCSDPFLCTKNTSTTTYTPSTLTISTYTSIGDSTWEAPAYVTSVEYLIVGGGGGGGAAYDTGSAGGGGGGLVLYGTMSVTPGNTYNITVGDGGDGGVGIGDRYTTRSENNGSNGSDSIFDTITAYGGGGYKSRSANGNAGLGGSVATTLTAPTGGNGAGSRDGGENGGGGGGNTTAGGSSDSTPQVSKTGGAGLTSSISGTSLTYGAGGAGGTVDGSSDGLSGSNNRGNGGGGATSVSYDSKSGGKGGSGIVILKYYI